MKSTSCPASSERPHDRGADALAPPVTRNPRHHLRLRPEDEAGVLAAEAEGVREHVAHAASRASFGTTSSGIAGSGHLRS